MIELHVQRRTGRVLHSLPKCILMIELHVQRRTGRVLHSLPKCILKSFKFLGNNLDTYFTSTYYLLMTTF